MNRNNIHDEESVSGNKEKFGQETGGESTASVSTDAHAARASTDQATTARREKTKNQLIEGAFRVFSRVGVSAASIEMICEEAGFTRGAFYSNFESKEQLLLEVVRTNMDFAVSQLDDALQEFTETYTQPDRPKNRMMIEPDEVSKIIDQIVPYQFSEVRWFIVFAEFRLAGLRDEKIGKILLKTEHEFHAQIAQVLTKALEPLGLQFTVPAETGTKMFLQIYQNALWNALLQNADDISEKAREIAMQEIPDLIEVLIRPLK